MDTSLSNDATMYAAIVGFLMPAGIAVIQQPKWSAGMRSVVTFLLCVAAAGGTVYFTDGFDGGNLVHAALITFVVAIASYHGLQRQTIAPAIERETSPAPKPPTG